MSHSLFDVNWNEKQKIPSMAGYAYTITGYDNPTRARLRLPNERTIVASLYNRIATDVAAVPIRHVRTNQNGTYKEDMDSSLNQCLTVEANVDQTGRELIFDAVISMFDEGSVALVPTESNVSMRNSTFDVLSIRTAKILSWKPREVQVRVYNDQTGQNEDLWLPKSKVAIIQNPFYSVMNQNGSMAKRLIEKLNQSDAIDAKNASAKLDMVIQLPYAVKSPARKKMASERIDDLTKQIQDSEYGIGYIDATEKMTQINRAIENNMMKHIEWMTGQVYSQIGVSEEIFKGTADEKISLNYYNQTVEPVLSVFVNEIRRKFLSKTARSQGQDIMFFRDPFRLVPVNEMADIGDKFTRNEIVSSNEMRSVMGMSPADDERADELRNKNMPMTEEQFYDPVMVDEGSDY